MSNNNLKKFKKFLRSAQQAFKNVKDENIKITIDTLPYKIILSHDNKKYIYILEVKQMTSLKTWWKRLFELCEHEWSLAQEGQLQSFVRKPDRSWDYENPIIDGHFKDWLCVKCKKAKRSEWRH